MMHYPALQQRAHAQMNRCCAASSTAKTICRSAISSSSQNSTTKPPLPLSFGVASSSQLLPRRDVLIVHEPRKAPSGITIPGERVGEILRDSVKTTISLADPAAAADLLASAVSSHPELSQIIRRDVLFATSALSSVTRSSLSAKLEVVTKQSCPKWHSDYVGCRCLVTYSGPGTLYAPPAAVSLLKSGNSGGSAIGVDEREVVQAEPFDFLFLKGRVSAAETAWTLPPPRELAASFFVQNNHHHHHHQQQRIPRRSVLALGAVHKSPADASEDLPRLVLTVDDSCQCCS